MVTRADLGLMRLVAQRVAGPSPGGPTDVVAWLVAAQAQDLLGALESIALRTAEGHVDDVRSAFDAGKVIRTWPMRGTLHAVRADDASWLTELLADRPLTAMARRRQDLGLDDDDVALARRVLVDALSGEALAELALRYLRAHGPATEQDLARWAGLPLRDVRAGIAGAGDELTTLEVDGTTHYLDPATRDLLTEHRRAASDVHLLPGFDEIVLGYADRSATIPPEHASRVVPGGNGVFRGTVLHEGVAVGTWRWTGTGRNRRRTAEPFTSFAPAVTAALETSGRAKPALTDLA